MSIYKSYRLENTLVVVALCVVVVVALEVVVVVVGLGVVEVVVRTVGNGIFFFASN